MTILTLIIFSLGGIQGINGIGGFVGTNIKDETSIEGGYWNKVTSGQQHGIGQGDTTGVSGLTTFRMTGSDTKENMSNFDWEDDWTVTSNYPVLQ